MSSITKAGAVVLWAAAYAGGIRTGPPHTGQHCGWKPGNPSVLSLCLGTAGRAKDRKHGLRCTFGMPHNMVGQL